MPALLIGRYQPLHDGHDALIRESIRRYGQVTIGLRDTAISEKNPYTVKERRQMFRDRYAGEIAAGQLRVVNLRADVTHVVHGRKVGWKVEALEFDPAIEAISATEIRSVATSSSSSEAEEQ